MTDAPMSTPMEAAFTTPGLVNAHHHLYSALARGMPGPPRTPVSFAEILELVWWRLDRALDLESIRWSAMLGALEALEAGTTAIVDHHESPDAIEGSLDVVAEACATVGVRAVCAYGVSDRHGPDGARRGLAENERFLRAGGRGMVGVHAAFTCSDETLDAAAGLARDLGVGVHVHVAEDGIDEAAGARLAPRSAGDWLLAHCVHLETDAGVRGTIAHNASSNLNNAVGYAAPARFANRVALGTDGIGGGVVEEYRVAFLALRAHDVTASPEMPWRWLEAGWDLVPEARADRVTWGHAGLDRLGPGPDAPGPDGPGPDGPGPDGPGLDPWTVAYTPGIRPVDVEIDGELVLHGGRPTRVDPDEVRARAREEAERLWARL